MGAIGAGVVVGPGEGAFEGQWEGAGVGAAVGRGVGDLVGTRVGKAVGSSVGVAEGACVGSWVGELDGVPVILRRKLSRVSLAWAACFCLPASFFSKRAEAAELSAVSAAPAPRASANRHTNLGHLNMVRRSDTKTNGPSGPERKQMVKGRTVRFY